MTRGWAGIGWPAWSGQLRDGRGAVLTVAAVVFVAAFSIAAMPRVLEAATVDDLEQTLREASPEQRNLRFVTRTEIGAGAPGRAFSNIEYIGGQLRDEHIPPSVLDLVAEEQWIFDSPQFVVASYPDEVEAQFPPTFRFRQQSGIADHMTLIEGSFPEVRDPDLRLVGDDCPEDFAGDLEEFEPTEGQDCGVQSRAVFETVLTTTTAGELGVAVGDRFVLRPQETELGFRAAAIDLGGLRLVVEVSGLIELDPPDDEFWYGDTLLHRPRVTENSDLRFVFAAGLLGPEQYRSFRAAVPGAGLDFSWRYLLDPDLVEDTDSEALVTDLEKIAPPDVDVVTQLPSLLEEHLAQRRLTLQVWSMVGFAFAVAAVGAVATLAAADADRRAQVTEIFDARGRSRRQAVVGATASAAVVIGGSTALAACLAALIWSGTGHGESLVAAAAFVVVGSAGYVVADGRRDRSPASRAAIGRALVVLGAAATIVLLRRRDRDASAAADRLDPTLMVAPALVVLALGLLAIPLIGPGLAVVERRRERTADVPALVGVRRAIAGAETLRGVLLSIALAAGLSIFSVVVAASIARAQDDAANQRVGDAQRVESTLPGIPLPGELVDELRGLDSDASLVAELPFQRFSGERGGFVVDLAAVEDERVAFDEVVLVGPWDAPHLPDVGDSFSLEIDGFVVPLQATARSTRFPGIDAGRPTVLVARNVIASLTTERIAAPNLVTLDAGSDDTVRATVGDQPAVAVTSRRAVLDDIANDPLARWTRFGLRSAGLVGVVLAAIGSVAAAEMASRRRHRDLGLVAVVGGSRRTLVRAALLELAPLHLGAGVVGIAAGLIAARLLRSNLAFGSFASDRATAGLVITPGAIVMVSAVVLATLALVVARTSRAAGRLDRAKMLREGSR